MQVIYIFKCSIDILTIWEIKIQRQQYNSSTIISFLFIIKYFLVEIYLY